MSDHDPSYAAKLVALLKRPERTLRTFVDAGACRGDFTALLAAAFPGARVHAFEPDPAMCDGLERRFQDTLGVQVCNLGLHERPGTLELQVHADPGTSSLLPRPSHDRRYFSSHDRVVATRQIPVTSLDAFLDEQTLDRLDLVKLDTQGAELSILRGAHRALKNASIDVIYTEFFVVPHYEHAPLLHDLLNHLGAFGYSMYDLFKGPNAANGQLRFGDAIFVSPAFRASYLDPSPEEP